MKKHFQSLKQQLLNIPVVIRYGVFLGFALICVKTLEYQMFSFRLNQQFYVGLIACFFLFLGLGAGYLSIRFANKQSTEKLAPPILTVKELNLLRGLAKGLTNQQLADMSFLSVNTIKTHLKSVYRKLAVKNRSEAVAKAKNMNLLKP
jgi:DNA-binding CsgD family transcriptional regulator